jgi:hypothetical protein
MSPFVSAITKDLRQTTYEEKRFVRITVLETESPKGTALDLVKSLWWIVGPCGG